MELIIDWLHYRKSRIIIFLIRHGWETPSCLGCSLQGDASNSKYCNKCRSFANGLRCYYER